MKTKKSRRSQVLVNARRWAAYATAGAASAFAATESADAGIVYSGVINESIRGSTPTYTYGGFYGRKIFPMVANGESFALFRHRSFYGTLGNAHFGGFPPGGTTYGSGQPAGFSAAGFLYASNVPYGANVSALPFGGVPAGYWATMAWNSGYGASQFLSPGVGYLGFRFDTGAGTQYGWARVDMDGAPYNGYTLIDWAYADPGEAIAVGQTGVIPEPGSLGLLAAGAVGLLAWRRARAKKAA